MRRGLSELEVPEGGQCIYKRETVGGAQWRKRKGRQDLIGHFKGLDLQPRGNRKPLSNHKLSHDKVWALHGE